MVVAFVLAEVGCAGVVVVVGKLILLHLEPIGDFSVLVLVVDVWLDSQLGGLSA